MADVTRPTITLGQASTQETKSMIRPANQDVLAHSGGVAGEDLQSGQPVYQKAADGLYYRSDANGSTEEKQFHGMPAKDAKAGQPVTVVYQGHMGGYTALVPGKVHFVSNTKGEIADAAGTAYLPVGRAINAYTLLVLPYATVPATPA